MISVPEEVSSCYPVAPDTLETAVQMAVNNLSLFLYHNFPLKTKWQVPELSETVGETFTLELTGEAGDESMATIQFGSISINGTFDGETKGYWFALTAQVKLDMQINPRAPTADVAVMYRYSSKNGKFLILSPCDSGILKMPPELLQIEIFVCPHPTYGCGCH